MTENSNEPIQTGIFTCPHCQTVYGSFDFESDNSVYVCINCKLSFRLAAPQRRYSYKISFQISQDDTDRVFETSTMQPSPLALSEALANDIAKLISVVNDRPQSEDIVFAMATESPALDDTNKVLEAIASIRRLAYDYYDFDEAFQVTVNMNALLPRGSMPPSERALRIMQITSIIKSMGWHISRP